MMPNLNTPTEQPPSAPEAQPPSTEAAPTVDWQKEAAQLKRQYDGLQGQFSKLKGERDELAGTVRDMTSDYEGKVATLQAERAKLLEAATEFESKFREVDTKYSETAKQLTVLQKHPDLAPDLLDGVLRLDGLEGDALDAYLEKYVNRQAARGKQEVGRRIEGAAPPAPHQPNQTPVTYQDAMQGVEVARDKYGTGSPEYTAAMSLYLRAIQAGQHRS